MTSSTRSDPTSEHFTLVLTTHCTPTPLILLPTTHHTPEHPPCTHPPDTPTTASPTSPIPRGIVPRPRPMSLPPQAYTPAHSGTSSDRTRQYVEQPHATPPKHSQRSADTTKSRTTNRILGDYTLSKTLGAGSMGKVKLAHHNLTGEKVCGLSHSLIPRTVVFSFHTLVSIALSSSTCSSWPCLSLIASRQYTSLPSLCPSFSLGCGADQCGRTA